MSGIAIILAAIIVTYVVLLGLYLSAWKKQVGERSVRSSSKAMVSIVVAARDEEHTIIECIDSLLAQSYDGDFEILLVDDHSGDATYTLAVENYADDPRVRILQLNETACGKKAALKEGISRANGDIIATVDADCIVGDRWLEAMMSEFEYGVQIATGPVLIGSVDSDIEGFQALDLMSLALVTGGGHYLGLHRLGNGANLLFRREAFESVGGYDSGAAFASGDDLFLIQSICEEYGTDAVAYCGTPEGVVWTKPESTVGDLIKQRERWASKNSSLPDQSIQLVWAFVWVANIASFIGFILAALGILPLRYVLAYLAIKMAIEYFALSTIAGFYGLQNMVRRWFLISFLLNIAYVSFIGFKALTSKDYTWKGRHTR